MSTDSGKHEGGDVGELHCRSQAAHDAGTGSCMKCRHARFNPGPATTSPRRLNFYGHFKRGRRAKLMRLLAGVKPTPGSALWRFLNVLALRVHMLKTSAGKRSD